MAFDPNTGIFAQSPGTTIDPTPDGDTVKEGFTDRLTPAMTELYNDLNTLRQVGSIGLPDGITIFNEKGVWRAATVGLTDKVDLANSAVAASAMAAKILNDKASAAQSTANAANTAATNASTERFQQATTKRKLPAAFKPLWLHNFAGCCRCCEVM